MMGEFIFYCLKGKMKLGVGEEKRRYCFGAEGVW